MMEFLLGFACGFLALPLALLVWLLAPFLRRFPKHA